QRTYSLLNQPENSVLWAEKLLAQSAGDLAFWQKQLKRADLLALEEARFRKRMLDTRELCIATHFNAATLLRKLGRKSEAIAHLDAVVQLDPEQSTAYSNRAQNLFDLGRFEEARANLDDFLRLSALPFDHPDTQRALKTQLECERKLQALNASAK
ncbi:MAG TPA: hypothetical protein VM509_14550, partial [Planctomycetota bacterium]|nr:hypothetical protein [Planctomycetota bacterium]